MVAVALASQTPDTDRNEWRTPPALFRSLDQEFAFTVDAAASDANALCGRYWTEADSSLAHGWAGERVWCNPPYGRGPAGWQAWVHKAFAETHIGGCPLAVLLIPADTSTSVWHTTILRYAREVRFVRGRVRFLRPDGRPADMPTFASAVVTFSGISTAGPAVRSWHWTDEVLP